MGYTFRSRLESSEDGEIAVIQMKDLRDDNIISNDTLTKLDMATMREHLFVQPGDLVFRSRGQVNTAAIVPENPVKTIVSAPLLRIRITKTDLIIPAYLKWYINQKDAQNFLNSRTEGTLLKMISKQVLEDLEIIIPTLEKQRRIVELAALFAREQFLLHTLIDKREQYLSTRLIQIAKGK